MYAIHQLSFYFHVFLGACALLMFWVPVFARKGALNHRRFGRYFAMAMYIVSISGAIMASLDLLMPLATHARGIELTAEQAASNAANIRGSAIFLLSLSVLVFVSTRQGWLAILHKSDRSVLRTPLHLTLCGSLMAVGVVLFITGVVTGSILFMIFSVLEVIAGFNCLRYALKSELEPKEWWIEHLNGLIGSGIGAYTAFFVFGGSRVLSNMLGSAFDDASIFLWVTPGVVGSIAITLLSRKYRARFDGSWAMKRAELRSDMVR